MESSSSTVSPSDPVQLSHGLSLVPRLRILLSFIRSDLSVKPIDDWQLKESLKAFIKEALSVSVLDKDLTVNKEKDFHKKRRGESVASGALYIWDLQAVGGEAYSNTQNAAESSEIRFRKTAGLVVDRLNGIELHIGGLKLRCKARLEDMDDFNSMKNSWQAVRGLIQTGYQMANPANHPNTLIIRGVPSRWFAEPRVSSKASVLVTHSIFSQFGSIRNLDVREDDLGRFAQNIGSDISTAFSCHSWVQYEQYSSFCNAMRAFCGRSMLREGSSFKGNYELSWDEDGYFTEGNIRKRKFEKEKIEEQRRWQLFNEARQAEIALRQAELARLEQENREIEQMQRLREEEEKRKQEIDLTKKKEEILRKKQVDEENFMLRKEQEAVELLRTERMLWDKEHPEKEDQQIKRHPEDARQRAEQKRQSEGGSLQQVLQTDEDIARFDHHHRRSEGIHRRIKEERMMEEEHSKKSQHGHREMSGQHPEEGLQYQQFERWLLLDAPSTLVPKVKTLDAGKADDHAVALVHARKRLRSIIVDSRIAFQPVDSLSE